MLQRSHIAIALGCFIALVIALTRPDVARAQARGEDRVPSQLWKTYPLDPSEGKARLRTGTQPERQGVSPPDSVGGSVRGAEQGQPARVGNANSDPLKLALLALLFLGLLLLVLVARPMATMAASLTSSLARFGAATASPLRSVAIVSRPSRSGRPFRLTVTRRKRAISRASAALRAWLITRTSHVVGSFAGRTASHAFAVLGFAYRATAAVATGLLWGAVYVISKRYHIFLYALVALTSAALGIAVVLLLGG
jgi:hypothetical protein